jgi:hypothetical protein
MRDDLSQALRRLRSRPALILAAAAMLGLGIGLTTAMFTLVDALVLRPVPFRDAERLTSITMLSNHTGRRAVSPAPTTACSCRRTCGAPPRRGSGSHRTPHHD